VLLLVYGIVSQFEIKFYIATAESYIDNSVVRVILHYSDGGYATEIEILFPFRKPFVPNFKILYFVYSKRKRNVTIYTFCGRKYKFS